jgi:hypothetical protein
MKDSQFGAWSGAICFSKLKLQILDWCFPKKSNPNKIKSFEREVEMHQDLTKLIHQLVKKEFTWAVAERHIKKFFELRRIRYEGELKLSAKKIWEEAPELFEESTVRKIKLEDPKILTTLRRFKRSNHYTSVGA